MFTVSVHSWLYTVTSLYNVDHRPSNKIDRSLCVGEVRFIA